MRQATVMVWVLLALGAQAHAAVLCGVMKRGKLDSAVTVRDACRKKETQLDPVTLGLQGPKGDTGDTGSAGIQGDPGETGPPGSAGGGLDAYASISNDSGSAYNVTIGGVSIDLFDTAVARNITLTTPIVTLPSAGTYRFHYCVRTTANTSASTRLVVNGSAINASIIVPVIQTSQFCRSTMLSLISANSTVQVQLFGILAPVTLVSPGGAELVIEKLN